MRIKFIWVLSDHRWLTHMYLAGFPRSFAWRTCGNNLLADILADKISMGNFSGCLSRDGIGLITGYWGKSGECWYRYIGGVHMIWHMSVNGYPTWWKQNHPVSKNSWFLPGIRYRCFHVGLCWIRLISCLWLNFNKVSLFVHVIYS